MIPFGNEIVTLYHRSETVDQSGKHHVTYTKKFLRNCSWRVQDSDELDNLNGNITTTVTCRIPAMQSKPAIGDLLVHGTYSATITSGADMQAVIEEKRGSFGAFFVTQIADNSMNCAFPIPHYKAVGGV